MNQVSEKNNYSNHRIHSYDKMSEMIIKLGSKNVKTIIPHLSNLPAKIICYNQLSLTPLKKIYPMLIVNMT